METGKEYVVPITTTITSKAIQDAIDKMLEEDKEKKVIVYINGIVPQVMKVGKDNDKD